MKTKLKALLIIGKESIPKLNIQNLENKPSETKWSKKEILGHLIDSAVNNLQRFTEIQFSSKPYAIKSYKQNELVKANNYQNANSNNLLLFWLSINNQILHIIDNQTEDSLLFEIEFEDKTTSDLKFLMTDYIDHLEYHLNQILN